MKVDILDIGSGNILSVKNWIEKENVSTRIVTRPNDISSEILVLPSVGSAGSYIQRMKTGHFDEAIKEHVERGRRLIVICLGFQVMMDYSEEDGDAEDYYTLSKVLDAGLSPLVFCVNDYFKNDIGWHKFHNLITYFDVDSFVFNPDISIYKDLVCTSIRKLDHLMLPFLQLHTVFPVHVAQERKLYLLFLGGAISSD